VGFEKMNKFSRDRITEILAHGSSPEERNGCQIWACQCFGEQRRDKHRQVGHGHNFGAIAKSHGYGFSA
ncbi:MAG: hypothetical protein U9M97_03510, partial [Candidatus Hadarchaeota archaeon]|nr:hypothetical protein [Candidatus Hadarchaeota archaeon]